ncbi:MAG: diguanylate cyclase, partial [Paraburkholderia tropica]
FVGTPNLDGVRRLYVYKRLPDLPLIVAVAPAMSTVYAEWWARATWFGALILAFTAIKAAGTWLFVRELRRRQRAEASLERMAHHDPLTGLENRATFDDVLAREWKCARRNEKPLSLLFIDIDRFKSYNDQYGHQAGDVALKSVATRIAACLDRPGDHAARYGGEEFIVVLPDTDTRGAALMAEKIRSAVFNLQIEHRQAPLQMLTVSIGVSTTAVDRVTDASTLLKTADMALYEAKRLGRNCVSIVPQLDTECAA